MINSIRIETPDLKIKEHLVSKIDNKTKPLGSLGQLEDIALKVGIIQQSLTPQLCKPSIVVFAGDHGIATEGVSAYPQEVTHQMVLNFVRGGAAINVFCHQHEIELTVVDAGVSYDFGNLKSIINSKIGYGTKSFLHGPAMTKEELGKALREGGEIVNKLTKTGCNVIGLGEMGIGNTAAASMIMSRICTLPVAECVGRGTGINDRQLEQKLRILTQAEEKHVEVKEPLDVLQTFGGFEIAQMCGAMLQAATNKMLVLVDGFIASSAFLVANALHPEIKEFAIICHQSDEQGHQGMIDYIGLQPVLDLCLRLGEGTGCALAYPVIKSAVTFLNEMASFESAGISKNG